MKTELTIRIENALHSYLPRKFGGIELNLARKRHIGYEVLVDSGDITSGIADCVRADEYFYISGYEYHCRPHGYQDLWFDSYGKDYLHCLLGHTTKASLQEQCDMYTCKHIERLAVCENSVIITAFEIKITKSDFKSKFGHNFCGNLNYYVMPKGLFDSVKDYVPDAVGVIQYDAETQRLKQVKKATFMVVTDTRKMWALLNIMKARKEPSQEVEID